MSGKHPLYRKSTLGCTLEESLLDLIEDKKISENLSKTILEEFDKTVPKNLSTIKNKMTFKGHCHTYRSVDNVFMFLLENPTFVIDKQTDIELDFVKIVAFDAKQTKK